ncbi:sigma-54 interaction domain-containing protein [Aquimonas sp.]|jgi:transcriptional regulator with PAS, ATPase and Fis domain|uniref:sigma-54 interaction domain-containing protein n=1 Tax=Aquimonas sp. TaxID=1872588 RepID=UPI0037C1A0D9
MEKQPRSYPLIGDSAGMRATLAYADKVSRTDSTVLITGDTGTGKENLAHYIHAHSARHERPIVCIDCSAFPEGLIEGELFGYERGAFTGAHRAYPGKLSLADQGTLFLDEIGELPAPAQAKLLRVLETREVFPIGGSSPRTLDVRVIAATNRDLDRLAGTAEFRRDLFFRLNVARVHLPSLQARCEDIPRLLEFYIGEMTARTGQQIGRLADETLNCLMRYTWPGNVRELRNVVEALFVDPPSGTVQLADLPPNLMCMLARHGAKEPGERERIVSTLCETRWNKVRAAEKLQWSRMTLYRKMAKHGIDATDPH